MWATLFRVLNENLEAVYLFMMLSKGSANAFLVASNKYVGPILYLCIEQVYVHATKVSS